MANHYEYSVTDRLLSGVSYSSGETLDRGDKVTVEYIASDPTRSRIAGMRRAMFGAGVLFVVIFPLIGLLTAVFSMKFGASRNHFLRQGIFTTGVLKNKRATNVTVNKRTVYELTFEFTARDGSKQQARTSTSAPERLEDERQEPLLYDSEKPTDAYMLDSLPSRPQVDQLGELQGRGVAAVIALILPATVIAANAYVAMRWLSG